MENSSNNPLQETNSGYLDQFDKGKQELAQVTSTKDWVITILISAIPIVGMIMMLVWAFGDGTDKNKANWAKANLLVMVIMIAVVFVLYFLIFATIFAGMASSGFGS